MSEIEVFARSHTEHFPTTRWPRKPIPLADRMRCINDVAAALSDTKKFPRWRAANYFNSLNSMASPRALGPSNTVALAPTLRKYYHLPQFVENDRTASHN